MAELRLDPDALYVALDRRRRRQRLSWRAVAGEAGVSPAALSAALSRISGRVELTALGHPQLQGWG